LQRTGTGTDGDSNQHEQSGRTGIHWIDAIHNGEVVSLSNG
jgi:hypothetical protein